jgi:phosphoserine phosphatase
MLESFSSTLEAFIAKHAVSPSQPVAVFDCDGTVIKGDIGEAMLYYQLENFLFRISPARVWADFPRRDELATLYDSLADLPSEKRTRDRRFPSFANLVLSWYFDQLAEGSTEKACADIVRLLAGFSPLETREMAEATFAGELQAPLTERLLGRSRLPQGVRYIQESVAMLDRLNKAGFDIWVVSGSNQWSVEAVCQRLGVPSDHVIGITLVELGGMLSSTVQKPIPVGEGKVEAIRKQIGRMPDFVASDSLYDVPLFRTSTDLKVLVISNSDLSKDFFRTSTLRRDHSWMVIEEPTQQQDEPSTWLMQR